jgi:uncharacterized integral membrane protein (TIGR00698 family)
MKPSPTTAKPLQHYLVLLPGILVCLLIAYSARYAGSRLPVIGAAVFGILFGMAAGRFSRPESCAPGIRFTGRKLLQYSIVLLGFDMNVTRILTVGGQSLSVILLAMSAACFTAFFISKLLRLQGNTGTLIGVGTAICGGSAIAATAPVLGAKDEEVTQAISTIFLFNVLAVLLFPVLGRILGLSDRGFGIWAGTSVNDTSSVVASASAWSQVAGNDTALAVATIVKLTRTLMIIPVSLALSFHVIRKARQETVSGQARDMQPGRQVAYQPDDQIGIPAHDRAGSNNSSTGFSFARTFPWFVLGFVATSLINSFVPLPAGLAASLVRLGKFMIIMAMSAIGLSSDLGRLVRSGWKPLVLGLSCWAAVALVALSVQNLAGLW